MCGLLSDEAGFGAYLCEDFIGLIGDSAPEDGGRVHNSCAQ